MAKKSEGIKRDAFLHAKKAKESREAKTKQSRKKRVIQWRKEKAFGGQ